MGKINLESSWLKILKDEFEKPKKKIEDTKSEKITAEHNEPITSSENIEKKNK